MSRRKSSVGLCVLCAMVFGAITAQSAQALIGGTTAFTCSKTGSGFNDSHCTEAGGGSFSHVAIPGGTTTEVNGSAGLMKLKATISGVSVEFQSTEAKAVGLMSNEVSLFQEHYVIGTGEIEYLGVTVTAPAGKGCKVKTGRILTETLYATSETIGMALHVEPMFNTPLAVFSVEGCSIAALNGEYTVTGSVSGSPKGATVNFTHAATTEQETLKLRGQKAGIEGSLSFSGRAVGGGSYTPLSATTVET